MAKQTPLVCQHLEKISKALLEKHQDSIREFVRKRHGVYALYRGGRLYYVGLATNLRNRLRGHLSDRHGGSWERFSVFLTIGDRQIKELESLILKVASPPGNKLTGKFARSENLRSRLSREIRQRMRREYRELMGGDDVEEGKDLTARRRLRHQVRQPVLAKYVNRTLKLMARFKHRTLRASVRKNGTIRFQGKSYNSPSLAAAAACRRPTCNGWTFWTFERAPGDWVQLSTLRR